MADITTAWLAERLTPDSTRIYKTAGDVSLELHVFLPEGHAPTDRRGAIVFFFGGGWNGGTPSQFFPHCRYLATRGMVGCSAEYRVASRHGTPPQTCVADGKSAVRWLRAHAAELGIDPDRLAAGGGSAGGHVAAATGTTQGFDDPGDDPGVSCRPSALVLFNPVYDNSPDGYGSDRVGEGWRAFSPLHNITAAAPPNIVFLGTEDGLIPVATAQRWQGLMANAGVRSELCLTEGAPHGFFNFRDGSNRWFVETVQAADRFLAELGYVEGPPTLV